ncbi:MAG: peptidylprolyl isomerase [Candidatus Margulisiibacteriota bacterium]
MNWDNDLKAIIETKKGDIRLKLFPDKAPLAVGNFINLAIRGFFNGHEFFRVIPGFMIVAGCPVADGKGGPGYQFEDEFAPELSHNKPGVLGMVNTGPDTNGSQFYITHISAPWLDQRHTIFGEVLNSKDMEVVNDIEQKDVIYTVRIEGDFYQLIQNIQDRINEWNDILIDNYPDLPGES